MDTTRDYAAEVHAYLKALESKRTQKKWCQYEQCGPGQPIGIVAAGYKEAVELGCEERILCY